MIRVQRTNHGVTFTLKFTTKLDYVVWGAKECIKLNFSWNMYVSYMMQYDIDGIRGLILDEPSYLNIKHGI